MEIEKYTPNSLSVSAILGLIASGDIAVPEIQRPFVWKRTQVRDLLDSLYKGYPTGYLIIWKNPNVRLKDGSVSKSHEIAVIWPCLGLPLTAKFQLHLAVAVVPVIALKLNQYQLSSLCHNHKIRIMVDISIEPEALKSALNWLPARCTG